MCGTQALQKQNRLIVLHTGAATDPWLLTTNNIYPLFWFQIVTEKTFHIVNLFFLTQYSNPVFHMCLNNKYKKHIIQCFLLLHLDLYIKLLKQVAKHLNYFSCIITNIKSSTAFPFALKSSLQAILLLIKISACHA